MPFVKENPQWYMLELLDGFGSHHNCIEANELRTQHKILTMKEEGDPSHINQAYDRLTAKSDKAITHEGLTFLLKDLKYNKNIIDQWKLLACGLAAVRMTAEKPEIWRKSFISTNTHPTECIPFVDWCKKVSPHLHGADSYVANHAVSVDKYSLLPFHWQVMEPSLKRSAVEIVERYGGDAWSLSCCKELSRALSVPMKELVHFQPAIFCAIKDPSHIERGPVEDK
jgi:hypothetical protein